MNYRRTTTDGHLPASRGLIPGRQPVGLQTHSEPSNSSAIRNGLTKAIPKQQ